MKFGRLALSLFVLAVITLAWIPSLQADQVFRAAHATTGPTGDNAIGIKSISTRYDSEFEAFRLFGEVENKLKVPVQDVRLNVTFFNQLGNVTGSLYGAPYFSYLRPGEASAFDLVAQGNDAATLRDFSHYTISRTWNTNSTDREGLLRLDIREMSLDPCGYYRIDGTVTNLSKEHASGMAISAAFYNEQNQIVATGYSRMDDRLDPTKFGEFSLLVEKEALSHFAYYSLNVQNDSYSAAKFEGEDLTNFHSPPQYAGRIMTVVTEPRTYDIDEYIIGVKGQIPVEEVKKRDENSLVLIRVVTAAGLNPTLVTAPVNENGTFVRNLEFQMDENMYGEVFRIKAEFFGETAETTFAVKHPDDPELTASCDGIDRVAISELNAGPGGIAGKTNVNDFLSGKEIKLGSSATLAASIENKFSRIQNVTVIFEVFDSSGVAVHIYTLEQQLGPDSSEVTDVSWVPQDTGTYVVESFIVSTLDHPVLLYVGPPLSVKVTE